jgi:hypothetical protein
MDNKEPVKTDKTVRYATQFQYNGVIGGGSWYNRFDFDNLESANLDLKFAKEYYSKSGFKYKIRIVRREIVTNEYLEEE